MWLNYVVVTNNQIINNRQKKFVFSHSTCPLRTACSSLPASSSLYDKAKRTTSIMAFWQKKRDMDNP